MRNILSAILLCIVVITPLFLFVGISNADEIEDLQKQINDLNAALSQSKAATAPLESQLDSMQKQVAGIKASVAGIEADMATKKKAIDEGYKDLEERQHILSQAVNNYYIRSYYNTPLDMFFSNDTFSEVARLLAYQKFTTQEDKNTITNIALSIHELEEKRKALESEQKRLVVVKSNLDKQSSELDGVIKGAKDYQAKLSGQIADLSAKQQQIINARSGGFTFSIGEGELADEYLSSIKGFRESAPSGYFAIFSFGAYSHRNGMSQYGARARAEANQTVEDILKAYYPNATLKKDYPVMGSINVDGYGSMPFEDQYLHGIYEMPGSWHINALKAQAIAARTYAVRRTNNGQGSICTTQSCQVFKNERKGGAWEQAVNETKGWVLVDGSGNPVSTEYASTHGGWSKTSGWDTTDKGGGSNFIDKSWEKAGGSPWLYKAWWREGTSNSGSTCGRSNPWLSPQEMADIINAAKYRDDRVTPITTSCYPGTNPYSMDELRAKANGPSTVTGVNVVQGNGISNEVVFQTDKGEIRISASDFKTAFNLRAPGFLAIPQSSDVYGAPFFNIEKK